MTFLKPKLLSLLTALLVGTFAAYAAEWIQPQGNPGEWNVDAPVNVGLETQTKQGGLELNGLRSFLPAYVNYDSTVDLTAKPSTFQDLGLAVSGKVGADSYCDADGGNCKSSGVTGEAVYFTSSLTGYCNDSGGRCQTANNSASTGTSYLLVSKTINLQNWQNSSTELGDENRSIAGFIINWGHSATVSTNGRTLWYHILIEDEHGYNLDERFFYYPNASSAGVGSGSLTITDLDGDGSVTLNAYISTATGANFPGSITSSIRYDINGYITK